MFNFFARFILWIVIAVSFQCMTALLNRKGGPINWGLVSHTMVTFAVVTVGTTIRFNVQLISYVDNCESPGLIGYQGLTNPGAPRVIEDISFALGNWLADGLLVSSLFDAAFVYPGV